MNREIIEKIEGILAETNYNGTILVELNDEIVMEKAYGYADFEHHVQNKLETKFRLASITKTITATAILKLVEEGKISLETKVSDIMPDFPNGEKITIHNILSNTSGLAGFDLWGDFSEAFKANDVNLALIDKFKNKPLEFVPGEKYDYSNSGYFLLGYFIEKITGMKYIEYLKKAIFSPLGISSFGFDYYQNVVSDRANGYDLVDKEVKNAKFIDMRIAGGGGALFGNIQDLHKFDNALFSGRIISDLSLMKMLEAYIPIIDTTGYGYGWFVFEGDMFGLNLKEVYHTGGGPGVRTINAVYLEQKLKIIMLSNLNDREGFHHAFDLIEEVMIKALG